MVAYLRIYENLFIEALLEIQEEERPDLILPTVDVTDHGLSQTWR
jgi:carbamoylphosphate synthase large subunit